MSLLLDALKRAEQEKLARTPNDTPPPARERPSQPPPGSLELQPLTSIPGGSTLGIAPRQENSAHTAQTMFQAKAGVNNEPRSRGMVWATVGAIGVVLIAASAYVWYSITSLAPKQATYAARPRPAPLPAAAAGSVPLQQLPAPDAQIMASPLGAAPLAPSLAPAPALIAPAAPPRTPAAVREEAVAQLLRESAAAPATPPLRMDRTAQAARRVPADITAGYAALRQGDLPAARRGYSAAMAADPVNIDAQLGLATVEARSGNRTTAAMHYRRALDMDPRNSTALAGLAALSDLSRPDSIEAKLRGDLSLNPESGPLHFTLGNVYAAQGRWNEAQVEYFEAYRIEPGSADIAFNLAVSLDNLGQTRLAASFYTRALESSRTQAGQFDPAAVARRLAEIR